MLTTTLATITVPPAGVLIASGLDPEALEQLAQFTERHPAFCVCVFFLWFLRSAYQFWVMKLHESNAQKAALLSIVQAGGGLSNLVSGALGVDNTDDQGSNGRGVK